MLVTANKTSMFGRSALSMVGETRSSSRQQLDPVDRTEALKDSTSSEYKELQELKQRDREVRQHEQAHMAAGGAHVRGGASFSYQSGPDGRQYATGGEVQIDTSAVSGDPEATIRKMQVVRAAATAPAEPSAQDRSVAASATKAEADARAELREQQNEEAGGESGEEQYGGRESPRSRTALNAYQGAQRSIDVDNPGAAPLLDLTA